MSSDGANNRNMRGAPGKQTVYCAAGWAAPPCPSHLLSHTIVITDLRTSAQCQTTGDDFNTSESCHNIHVSISKIFRGGGACRRDWEYLPLIQDAKYTLFFFYLIFFILTDSSLNTGRRKHTQTVWTGTFLFISSTVPGCR